MNEQLKKIIKKEADDIVFNELSFDDRLKEKVRDKIRVEYEPIESKSNHTRWKKNWNARFVAASIVLLVASVPLLHEWIGDAPVPVAVEQDPVTEDPPLSVLMGGEGTTLESATLSWEFTSVDEVNEHFSDDVLVLDALRSEWRLTNLRGYGEARNDLEKIEFNYAKGNASLLVIAERSSDLARLGTYESIELRGQAGLKRVDSLSSELSWTEKGIYYILTGTLTDDELLSVAEKMTVMNNG